jgi:hypothetical protein
VTVKDPDPGKVGRAFSSAAIELALGNYPGCWTTTPPGDASPYGVYWPTLVAADAVEQVVVLEGGERLPVKPPTAAARASQPASLAPPPVAIPAAPPAGPTVRAPLGRAFGARSGDKGGNANVGVWARDPEGYAFLASFLTVERFQALLSETRALQVRRHELPNLLALNFVVLGLLGEGVSSSTRTDPQAKGLGEWLRARVVELPATLVAEQGG